MSRREEREQLTFAATGESKGGECSDDAEAVLGKDWRDLALRGIGSVDGEFGTRSCDDLLLFCTRELTQHSLSDGRGRLYSQAVHEHGTGGRHGEQVTPLG